MADFFTDLKQHFAEGNALKRLIIVNVVVFVVVGLIEVFGQLFKIEWLTITPYLNLSSNPMEVLMRPWTLLSYMFLHRDFLHIIFNMMWMYWFGMLFLQQFTQKQLVALYFFGGFSGALLYIVCYNFIPFFIGQQGVLIGASASILAIVCAIAIQIPDYTVRLLFIGEVKLKYIAGVTILIDLLSVTSGNAGGHVAHLGGALMGYIFIVALKSGTDITKGFNQFMDKIISLSKPQPRMKVKYRKAESDMEYRGRRNEESKNLDSILEKLKKSGYSSLTAEEKKFLFDASKK
ncbi:MAG: rhomboid family intramembrane serine protease [Bacteroidales bacterium]|nr:rhomboid family intramembrane serine protease [Bacteroidales bacterium]